MKNITMSLTDLLGSEYVESVCRARCALSGEPYGKLAEAANEKIEFFPSSLCNRINELTDQIGNSITAPFDNVNTGAATEAFAKASNYAMSPIGGLGPYRVGENGRLYFIGKSEHYHTPLGHNFPGYRLIDAARRIGIMNATHNNTRGYITRLAERQIVADVNGVKLNEISAILASKEKKVLNRVINLETGSLAVEAGIKMMLMRFYKLDKTFDSPKYSGKIPVFLVMSDNEGGREANYHGTTVIAQTMRGMWPEFYNKCSEIYKVVSVKINDIDDFRAKLSEYNSGPYKTAGFLHEIVLMNYGGIRLTEEFLQSAYAACEAADTPTLVDEIQSCMWYEGMFLFRQYGLNPDFAVIGKGFPGGEYPASKIITTYEFDHLNQFGALVTNGQEELASLAYLITMAFVRENGSELTALNEWFYSELEKLAAEFKEKVVKIEGLGLLAAIHFQTVDSAVRFAHIMNDHCFDVSAQTYKASCPPAALMKPPIIATKKSLNVFLNNCRMALEEL